jgi:hypothetical protein
MTEEEKDKACFNALFDKELEARIAEEQRVRTTDELAEMIRMEAEIESFLREELPHD